MDDSKSKNGTRSADHQAAQAEIDEQIARMREMLRLMAPGTGATALGAMRKDYPDVPLSDRVEALKSYR